MALRCRNFHSSSLDHSRRHAKARGRAVRWRGRPDSLQTGDHLLEIPSRNKENIQYCSLRRGPVITIEPNTLRFVVAQRGLFVLTQLPTWMDGFDISVLSLRTHKPSLQCSQHRSRQVDSGFAVVIHNHYHCSSMAQREDADNTRDSADILFRSPSVCCHSPLHLTKQ